MSARPDVREALSGVIDDDLQASIASLSTPSDWSPPTSPPAADAHLRSTPSPPKRLHRYKKLRLHARGGLGEVHVARDEELGREVALKEIRPGHADQPGSRARFVREAEMTGQLEHPGIVPVYGLGQHADGRPFYAMRFIRGETLHEAIARFHREDEVAGRRAGERELALRSLLSRFVAACYAVAYAHSRGVMHRDLKPANIMVGEFGEALVVDWGLAKGLYLSEGATAIPRPLPAVAGGSAATEVGQAVGTPAYMAPEQARGERGLEGLATDVFSLGATLYHLLTGQAPLRSLEHARRGEVAPAREVNKRVPQSLAAVCSKAMARAPQDRYPSARLLAEDVERWLADEPVTAGPETVRDKVRRWAKRHRTLVSGGVALLLASVAGLVLGLAAVSGEQAKTAEALGEAKAKRSEAEANLSRAEGAEAETRVALGRALTAEAEAKASLKVAKKAVDECFLVAKDHPALQGGHMLGVRRLLFSKARLYYEGFRRQRPADPSLAWGQVEGLFNWAYIESVVGRKEVALRAYREAREPLYWLAEAQSGSTDGRQGLARLHHNLGALAAELGRFAEALGEYERARRLRAGLVASAPESADHRYELAMTCHATGQLLEARGRADVSLRQFKQAEAILAGLTNPGPGAAEHLHLLALTHSALGRALGREGKGPEAAEEYRRVVSALSKLEQDHPRAGFTVDLASAHHELGNQLRGLGRTDEALKEMVKARDLQLAVGAALSGVPSDRSRLAQTRNDLGVLLAVLGRAKEALAELGEARAIKEGLAAAHPSVPAYSHRLAKTHLNLGNVLADEGRLQDALREGEKARDVLSRLVNSHPGVPDYAQDLAGAHGSLGNRLTQMGQGVRGLSEYKKALAILAGLVKSQPGNAEYSQTLGETHNNAGLLLRRMRRPSEALREHEAARDVFAALAKASPRVPAYRQSLALAHFQIGGILLIDLSRPEESLASWTEVIRLLTKLHDEGHGSANTRGLLLPRAHYFRAGRLAALGKRRESLPDWDRATSLASAADQPFMRLGRAAVLAQLGEHASAALEAEGIAWNNRLWVSDHYSLACIFSLSAASASRDRAAPLPVREVRPGAYARLALVHLRAAAGAGYFREPANVAQLDGDPDLAFLRGRNDYTVFRTSLPHPKSGVP